MATPKKPFPTSTRKAAQGALMIAMTALQDERVREQLRKTSGAAREWAAQRQAARRQDVIDVDARDLDDDAGGDGGDGLVGDGVDHGPGRSRPTPSEPLRSRLDPTRRFGQKGVERRVAALRRNVDLVFPVSAAETPGGSGHGSGDETGDATEVDAGGAIRRAVDELSNAVAISATMPINERRRARGRIDAELTRLENALVDAVLPPTGAD